MEPVEQMEQRPLGNNRTKGRKKFTKARKHIFTLNNYTEEDYVNIVAHCEKKKWKYVIGKEIGKKSGIHHLQGFIECKNPISFNTIQKLLPRARIKIAYGTMEHNLTYCGKDDNFAKSQTFQEKIDMQILETEYKNVKWHEWQQKVLTIIDSVPNSRTINWFWDSIGNIGKSFLTKFIDLKHDIIIADGKKDNIFNQIKIHMELEKIPKIIILDIPRHNIEYINYGVIEQIKNGLIYSGKYEGGKYRFPYPHIIIFANSPPNLNKLSLDRWNIIDITSLGEGAAPLPLAVCLPREQPARGGIDPYLWDLD